MKNVTIVIPTRNRIKKIEKTLESIKYLSGKEWLDIIIGVDNDEETEEYLVDVYKTYNLHYETFYRGNSDEPFGSVYIRNYIIENYVKDGLIYGTDDIVFERGSIVNAKEYFNNTFEDDDGIVGFVQRPSDQFHPTGVGLVGQTFLQRYPNKWLFNPDYFHFSCQEIYWLASKYDKFVQCKEAVIWHYNPCKFDKAMDQTHKDARLYKREDHRLIKQRKRKGLIWGRQ